MIAMNLLALTPGVASASLGLALVGIALAAIVLYWPRRFTGPLTDHERRAAKRVAGPAALALSLATPLLTIAGFALLLPPLVDLRVPSHTMGGDRAFTCEAEASLLSSISTRESTHPWVAAVLCHVDAEADGDALARAILRAAADGFRAPFDCRRRELPASDLASIELSLVEVAARAHVLTRVELDPGPRLEDPDPWDILRRTLVARDIPACRTSPASATGDRGQVLRLGHAKVPEKKVPETHDARLEVVAVVHGDVCEGVESRLLTSARERVSDCRLTVKPEHGQNCRATEQRVLRMLSSCAGVSPEELQRRGEHEGLLLSAGYGEARVHLDRPVEVEFKDSALFLKTLFFGTTRERAFAADLRERGLRPPADRSKGVTVNLDDEALVIAKEGASSIPSEEVHSRPELNDGPFSWSGIDNAPRVTCTGERVEIHLSKDRLAEALQDPTAKYAIMNTIAWAANVLTTSHCAQVHQPRALVTGARLLLSAEQMDEAVSALRRPRETLGLLCLGLALCTLALGLLRSAR